MSRLTYCKLFISFTIIIFSNTSCYGQSIYVGNNKYPSTPNWKFDIKGESWSGELDIAIAKTNSGGYLWLASEFPQGDNSYIGGTITMFLEDGSTIKCVYRNIRDNVDNQSITLYKLTNSEIDILKHKRIMTIRFQILNSPWSGTKTAHNINYRYVLSSLSENLIATEDDVTTLFN